MVDIPGTINGYDPTDAITLSDAQDWPGLVTFTQLEVSEQLEVLASVIQYSVTYYCFFIW